MRSSAMGARFVEDSQMLPVLPNWFLALSEMTLCRDAEGNDWIVHVRTAHISTEVFQGPR